MRITGIAEAGLFAPMRKPTAGGEDFAELFGLAQQQLELPAEEAEDSEANAPDDEWGVELLEQDVTFPEADRHAMLPNEPLDDLLAGLVAFGDPMVSESEAPIVVPRVSQVVERAVPRRPVTTSSTPSFSTGAVSGGPSPLAALEHHESAFAEWPSLPMPSDPGPRVALRRDSLLDALRGPTPATPHRGDPPAATLAGVALDRAPVEGLVRLTEPFASIRLGVEPPRAAEEAAAPVRDAEAQAEGAEQERVTLPGPPPPPAPRQPTSADAALASAATTPTTTATTSDGATTDPPAPVRPSATPTRSRRLIPGRGGRAGITPAVSRATLDLAASPLAALFEGLEPVAPTPLGAIATAPVHRPRSLTPHPVPWQPLKPQGGEVARSEGTAEPASEPHTSDAPTTVFDDGEPAVHTTKASRPHDAVSAASVESREGGFRVTAPEASGHEPDLAHQAARQAAAARVVNRLTLAGDAHASIDHPSLGRIDVAARRHDGEIDVSLRVHDPEAAAVLHSAAPQLERELRNQSVELGHLAIEADLQDGSTGDDAHAERERAFEQRREGTASAQGRDGGPAASAPLQAKRPWVRIVL